MCNRLANEFQNKQIANKLHHNMVFLRIPYSLYHITYKKETVIYATWWLQNLSICGQPSLWEGKGQGGLMSASCGDSHSLVSIISLFHIITHHAHLTIKTMKEECVSSPSLYLQCATTPKSTCWCISLVYICISNGKPSSPKTKVCI